MSRFERIIVAVQARNIACVGFRILRWKAQTSKVRGVWVRVALIRLVLRNE